MSKAWIAGKSQKEERISGDGRIQTLTMLDQLVAEEESQKALKAALADELKSNPMRFFRTVLMPLLPKDAKLMIDADGVMEWKSLVQSLADEAKAGEQNGKTVQP